MLRLFVRGLIVVRNGLPGLSYTNVTKPNTISMNFHQNFHGLSISSPSITNTKLKLLENASILQIATNLSRPLTKFSLQKGKRKAVKAVLKRFYRLNWGCWIHAKTGRHKKLWKKSAARKKRLQQHVMTNSSQSWLLDKMVTNYWRKPKYYVDDPYEPYHEREEFIFTRKNPL